MKKINLLIINLSILIVLWLVVEKTWFVLQPSPRLDEERAIRLREHPAYLNKTIALHNQSVTFRTDPNGYLLPKGGNSSAKDVLFFVGGSTTECLSVPEKFRFPTVVGDIWNKQGIAIQTINAGVSGNNTQLSLNIVLNKIAPSKPKAIVLMHAINDLHLYLKHPNYWEVTGKYSHLRLTSPTLTKTEKISPIIYPGLKRLWSRPLKEKKMVLPALTASFEKKLLTDFKRNLLLFIATCKAFGVQPILMTQANYLSFEHHFTDVKQIRNQGKPYFNKYQFLLDQLNQSTRDVAHQQQITLIDLDTAFSNNPSLFEDVVHLNLKGSMAVGEYIANQLIIDSLQITNKQ